MNSDQLALPILVPHDKVQTETLNALVESFILREGTDYGAVEISLEAKKNQVLKQLQKSEVVIVFDPNVESVTLLTHQDYQRLLNQI